MLLPNIALCKVFRKSVGFGQSSSITKTLFDSSDAIRIRRLPFRPGPVAIAAGELGSRLPEFSMKDLQGRELSSGDLRGKVVLVDFWATWCQPCKKEMPGYQNLLDRHGRRGFVVVGFKFDTMMDTEDPVLFAKRIGVRYQLAVASDELKQKFGGIEGLPTTMLYDRQGLLRKKSHRVRIHGCH